MATHYSWEDLYLDTHLKHTHSGRVIKLVGFDGRYRIFEIVDKGLLATSTKFCVASTKNPAHESLAGFQILCNFQKGDAIQVRDFGDEDWRWGVFDTYKYGSRWPFGTTTSCFTQARVCEETITIDNKEFTLEQVRKAVANLTPVN